MEGVDAAVALGSGSAGLTDAVGNRLYALYHKVVDLEPARGVVARSHRTIVLAVAATHTDGKTLALVYLYVHIHGLEVDVAGGGTLVVGVAVELAGGEDVLHAHGCAKVLHAVIGEDTAVATVATLVPEQAGYAVQTRFYLPGGNGLRQFELVWERFRVKPAAVSAVGVLGIGIDTVRVAAQRTLDRPSIRYAAAIGFLVVGVVLEVGVNQ